MLGLLVLGAVACGRSDSDIGTLPPANRIAPLSPAGRQDLEAQGAVCTPETSGPVLCTWTNGDTNCSLTYDTDDTLTRFMCVVSDLRYTCTRPSSMYACAWSDDEDCADVYDASGRFIAYLCGDALRSVIGGDDRDAGFDGGGFDGGGFDGGGFDGSPWPEDGGGTDGDVNPDADGGGSWDGGELDACNVDGGGAPVECRQDQDVGGWYDGGDVDGGGWYDGGDVDGGGWYDGGDVDGGGWYDGGDVDGSGWYDGGDIDGSGWSDGGDGSDGGDADVGPGDADPSVIGCADGEREGFLDVDRYPHIAACSGAWTVPGVTRTNGTPTCGRQGGDDGMRSSGQGCATEDLCAAGWHVCEGASEVTAYAATCDDAVPPSAPEKSLFFAVAQPSSSGSVCGWSGDNGVFGCGNLGSVLSADKGCGPLNRVFDSTAPGACGDNEAEAPLGPWACEGGADSHLHEGALVTKADCQNGSCFYDGYQVSSSDKGGVLCCRD